MPDIASWIKLMAPWIVTFFVAISTATSSSISLEGKSRWLMCSAPVPAKVVYNSKIAVSLSYLIPSILISCTMLTIGLQTNLIETIALFIVPLLFSIFISVVGLPFNLKYPKYDWTSEYYAVKQSVSTLATVGTGIASVLVFYVLTASLRPSLHGSAGGYFIYYHDISDISEIGRTNIVYVNKIISSNMKQGDSIRPVLFFAKISL